MNRVYNAQDVLNACNKLRQCKPDAFLACDIITGFPGETEEDFNETLSLCKKCNFSWIHAFPFSERPGTPACKIKPKIPHNVSGKRAKILTDWAIQQKINYIKYFTGKELSAILETKKICQEKINDTENYIYHCMTENFIHCQITTNKKLDLDKEYQIKIISPLTEKIKKGGEIEAQAKINN